MNRPLALACAGMLSWGCAEKPAPPASPPTSAAPSADAAAAKTVTLAVSGMT